MSNFSSNYSPLEVYPFIYSVAADISHTTYSTWKIPFIKIIALFILHQWIVSLHILFFSFLYSFHFIHSLLIPFYFTSSFPTLGFTGLRWSESVTKEDLRMRYRLNLEPHRLNLGNLNRECLMSAQNILAIMVANDRNPYANWFK